VAGLAFACRVGRGREAHTKLTKNQARSSEESEGDAAASSQNSKIDQIVGALLHMFGCCIRQSGSNDIELNESVSNPIVDNYIDPFADDDDDDNPSPGEVDYVNQYKVIRTLGKGAMGTVKLGETSDSLYAIKCMSKNALCSQRDSHREGRKWIVRTGLDKVKMEIAIMKKMVHPNVVRFYEVITSQCYSSQLTVVLNHIFAGDRE
jgi:hypothetical protein